MTIDGAQPLVNLTADFGYNHNPAADVNQGTGLAALGDRVWIDANGNGAQEPGEPGLGGVTVRLYYDHNGDGVFDALYDVGGYNPVRVTDPNGNYPFDDLPPGAYVVVVDTATLPAGYTQTGDPDYFGTTGPVQDYRTTTPVILAPGDVFINADFGYQPPAAQNNSVGNYVWFDANANGVGPNGNGAAPGDDNSEPGLAGVTVALIRDANNNGVWDPGEPIIATTVTGPTGAYLFTGVPDGRYLVWVNDVNGVLLGLTQSYDSDGLATLNLSAVALDPTSTNPNPVVDLAQDFGYTARGQTDVLGLIGDRVWLDINNDGVQDTGEPGVAGVTVQLYDSGNNLVATTTTDANGNYWFGGLPAGTYTVVVTPPTGLTQTYDADGLGTPHQSTVTIGSGGINLDQDFGYRGLGTIGNYVWEDRNANGVVDGNEASLGIGGVTLDLYWDLNGNGVVDPGEPRLATTTTAPDGSYLFSGLPTDDGGGNAQFVVVVTDTAGVLHGWWHSLGTAGADNHSQTDPYPVMLTPSAPNNLTADFGYFVKPAALGNRVWLDSNANGIQDAGEPPLANVVVTLTIQYINGITATVVTTTDATGFYQFGNLLLDEDQASSTTGTPMATQPVYTLSVSTPANHLATVVNAPGSTPMNDSDNHAGVEGLATQGRTDVSLNTDSPYNPNAESNPIAGYDFGFVIPTAGLLDFGDAPASYPVTVANGAGAHVIVPGFSLGPAIDAETDGQPTAGAYGDDLNGATPDDEDGVFFYSSLRRGQLATVMVLLNNTAWRSNPRLDAWIDWDNNRTWGAGEQIFVSQALNSGQNLLTFTVHASANLGSLYARFRLSDGGGLTPGGLAANGEVEDYVVFVTDSDAPPLDWGDLPEETYKTLSTSDGPRHYLVPTLRLGNSIDAEANGQPSAGANRDDLANLADEDGISPTALTDLIRGRSATIPVSVYKNTGSPATLWGWMDWNNDGVVDAGDTQAATVSSAGQQTVNLTYDVPAEAAPSTYARFRLASDPNQAQSPTGLALNGEVEDYVVTTKLPPTAAPLAYFKAVTAGEGIVQLTWGTLVENGVLGFRVERSTADGNWQRLTAQMIPATGWDGRPQSYGLVDANAPAVAGALYRLLETDLSGRERVLAVAKVEAGMTTGIARTETGLSLSVRGAPNASVTVQTAEAVEGPWTTVQTVTLDGAGGAVLNLGVDVSGPARFYRVVSE